MGAVTGRGNPVFDVGRIALDECAFAHWLVDSGPFEQRVILLLAAGRLSTWTVCPSFHLTPCRVYVLLIDGDLVSSFTQQGCQEGPVVSYRAYLLC